MIRLTLVVVFVVAGSVFFFVSRKKGKTEVHSPPLVNDTIIAYPKVYVAQQGNPHWNKLLVEYESYLIESLKKNSAPGVAVAIVKDSSVIFLKGIGIRDYATRDSIGVNSVFRLGSVSKCFASVLTGILVQEEVIDWEDKVTEYVPGFALKSKASTDSLTIAHLLSHTSGLPYHAYTDRVDEGAPFDTLVFHLRDLKLIDTPGKIYSYQNVAFSIISKVIQSATGKSYEDTMKEKLFDPLKMSHSSLTYESIHNDKDRAQPHIYTRKGWKPQSISRTYYNVGPAGGVNASIADMARWLKALTDSANQVIDQKTKEEIFSPVVRAVSRNRNFRRWKKSRGSYYGLGWRVLTFKDDTLNYHGGYVNYYRSEVAIKTTDRLGICVLVNSAGPLADTAIPDFLRLYEKHRMDILAWEKLQMKKDSIQLLSYRK